MRILILGNAHRPGVKEAAEQLLPWLSELCEIAVFDLLQEKTLIDVNADLALVLGGDGAILRAARQMGYRQTPVLGVNLGKLGFLADLSPDQLRTCLPQVLRGDYRVTHHLMFECVIESVPEPNSAAVPSRTILGLNEVVIRSGPPYHMVDLDLSVDGEAVSRYSGDGLILSTPVGSTAYNVAAGGPILGQGLDAFVITPICPHTLTNRPVVDSADKVYTIAIRRSSGAAALVVDGQEIIPISVREQVIVRRAPVGFQLIKVPGHSYYQTLRDKLRWGTQPNYRTEP